MITTKDRAAELRETLQSLLKQHYEPLELLVIDDASSEPMEALVHALWPDATVIRHEESRQCCVRRDEGFQVSRGEYILQLDDDCCLTQPNDLATAIRYLSARPRAGAVIFDLYNGPALPANLPPSTALPGCVASFTAAAALFRTKAIRETVGYRPFYVAQGEEAELGFQFLEKGWSILFLPSILAHHRLSNLNRNTVGTWRRGLGNDIWTLLLHLPMRRLPVEIGWKFAVSALDMVRLARYRAWAGGIWRCVLGVGTAWRHRKPLPPLALRRFDALRIRGVLTEEELENPPAVRLADLLNWWSRWKNRARDASRWQRQTTTGSSGIARFAHEFPGAQHTASENKPAQPNGSHSA